MTKESTITFNIETELKTFLQDIADEKDVSLSEYVRFVLKRGLDAIYQRNLQLRELERSLK